MARILVIDDDAEIRNLVAKFLVLDGHEVDTAENGLVGLKMIESNQYDLLITDIVMPEQDGFGVLMELRRISAKVPIIVMTGGTAKLNADNLMLTASLMKADKVLQKPLNFEKLQATVRELLESVKS
jgi:DNA-binding response OmpR family regulator